MYGNIKCLSTLEFFSNLFQKIYHYHMTQQSYSLFQANGNEKMSTKRLFVAISCITGQLENHQVALPLVSEQTHVK